MTKMTNCVFFLFLINASISAGPFMRNGDKVYFNTNNYVYFVDEGRTTTAQSIKFGDKITFYWHENGEVKTVKPKDTTPVTWNQSSQIYKVKYKDASHIWVWSRLGNIMDGLVLINLKTGELEQEYRGNPILVSPDKQHVAFVFPDKFLGDMVFMDDKLIWPEQHGGFVKAGMLFPENATGQSVEKIVSNSKNRNHRVRFLPDTWLANNIIKFLVSQNEIPSHKKSKFLPQRDFFVKRAVLIHKDNKTTISLENVGVEHLAID